MQKNLVGILTVNYRMKIEGLTNDPDPDADPDH